MTDIQQYQLVFLLLLLFIAVFGALAQRLKLPYPILLVIGGLLISLIPNLPHVALRPDYVFVVILPPLLYSAAFETSWRDFLHNITSISMLAFGLVAFTTFGIGLAAHWLLPGFDWRLGMTLGAILSPTDALAATAIAKRLGLPQRVTDIIEGESLVNDASGLLALKLGVGLVVSGSAPSFWHSSGELVYLIAGGIAIGLLIGLLLRSFERWVDNGPVEITLSIVTPYLAYIAAEQIHASGILAVVACGLYLGRRSSIYLSSSVRLQTWSTWNALSFVLNGLVFLLIGLQLPFITAGIRGMSRRDLAEIASIAIAVVILLRLIWVMPAAALSGFLSRKFRNYPAPISPRTSFVIGWTGMRGVMSLAAALSLPLTIDDGNPFPQREVIIFIAFCVIFATLVLQGLTLPLVIRALGLAHDSSLQDEEKLGRHAMLKAALQELERIRALDEATSDTLYEGIAETYRRRLDYLESSEDEADRQDPGELMKRWAVASDLRAVEHQTIVQLRDENQISDTVLRKLERELDLLEVRFPRPA